MTTTLHAAALQLSAHDRSDFVTAWPGILTEAARTLEAGDVDLLVMPEATIPGYILGGDDLEEQLTLRALDDLARLAARTATVIVVGAAMRAGTHLRNAAVAIDRDGSIAGRADKAFLWHFDRRWFEPADAIAPIATSAGLLGALICADGRLPTIAQALVAGGARLLVMPTAWVSSGRDPRALENVQADLLGRIRAYENAVPFVAANKCGVELGIALYCGKSQIVDASGTVLAMAGERVPEAVHARVEIPQIVSAPRPASDPIPAAPRSWPELPLRVAISASTGTALDPARLDWLQADYLVAPNVPPERAQLAGVLATAAVDDAIARDPGGIARLRRAGYRAIVWDTRAGDGWTADLARARALEARVYVIVIDRRQDRAFAVDPDGAIVCGTFGDYRVAGFSLDPRRTSQTAVAPDTDVVEGLDRVAQILAGNYSAS